MANKKSITTIKVSRRVKRYIDSKAKAEESVDETLLRLFKLANGVEKPAEVPPPTTTIKVSTLIMKFIKKQSKPKESRDQTISRLLGIMEDDGNVRGADE